MSIDYSALSTMWAGQAYQTKGSSLNLGLARYSDYSQGEADFYASLTKLTRADASNRFDAHLRGQLDISMR